MEQHGGARPAGTCAAEKGGWRGERGARSGWGQGVGGQEGCCVPPWGGGTWDAILGSLRGTDARVWQGLGSYPQPLWRAAGVPPCLLRGRALHGTVLPPPQWGDLHCPQMWSPPHAHGPCRCALHHTPTACFTGVQLCLSGVYLTGPRCRVPHVRSSESEPCITPPLPAPVHCLTNNRLGVLPPPLHVHASYDSSHQAIFKRALHCVLAAHLGGLSHGR